MMNYILKRHPSPGWIVVDEVPNSTGGQKSRIADAVALGVWPSHQYAIHGYEFKISRSDVRRELEDPSKADAVGKFCDYWWLVVSDIDLIDGLVIPETWGILHVKNNTLKTHRKAPKLSATPISRGFAAALIRRVTDSWVPKREYNALKERTREEAKAELVRDRELQTSHAKHELRRLKQTIEHFEQRSGISLQHEWQHSQIGDAVKHVLEAREVTGRRFRDSSPEQALAYEIANIERSIERHRHVADGLGYALVQVKSMLEKLTAGQPVEPHKPSSGLLPEAS